jgi:hypothetical protein
MKLLLIGLAEHLEGCEYRITVCLQVCQRSRGCKYSISAKKFEFSAPPAGLKRSEFLRTPQIGRGELAAL